MFKPLLKTIPSLSGNMKIVCNLEGYNIDSSNKFVYNCDVNKAYLTSISSNLYDKNIPLNLKNNSFEYDIKKFYLYYANVFYKTNYNYSQINIPVIDFTSNINDNNTDFKYGCKRVSYLKSDNQLAFFAPIYVEGIDDIKGKYFIIRCTFNKVYKITKFIKIKISNINENNNLADYLCRYAEKIDDKVIYCSNTYKNIYYGIDVRNGGFIKVEDNISSNLFNKYFTINDFDATLNNGFKRNYMMMKQIIPLSFYFDPNELLYDFEKPLYSNAEIIISGAWYDENNQEIPFYDFSDDYSKYEEDIYNLYYDNVFKYLSTGINIMDVKYPACNEASAENYRYVNTVSKNYNRWKLKYSNDDYPYIINNNYAFSFNQGSLYTYKEFPIMYSAITAYGKLVSNTEYNLLFDYDDIYKEDEITIINNKKKYFNLYNQNYIANFFDITDVFGFNNIYDRIFIEKIKEYSFEDCIEILKKDGKIAKYLVDDTNEDLISKKYVAYEFYDLNVLNNDPNVLSDITIGSDYYIGYSKFRDAIIYSTSENPDYDFIKEHNLSKYIPFGTSKLMQFIMNIINTYGFGLIEFQYFCVHDYYQNEEYYFKCPIDKNKVNVDIDIKNYKGNWSDELTVWHYDNYETDLLGQYEIPSYSSPEINKLNIFKSLGMNDQYKIPDCNWAFWNDIKRTPLEMFFFNKQILEQYEVEEPDYPNNLTRMYASIIIRNDKYEIVKIIKPELKRLDNNILQALWYEVIPKDIDVEIKTIFDENYLNTLWSNVSKDGKVYHKGILYDLNTIYNNNLDMDFKIDKFALFVSPSFNYTLAKDFSDIYKESKYTFTYDFTAEDNYYDISKIYNQYELFTKSSYLLNHKIVVKDKNGPYVDTSKIYPQYDKTNNTKLEPNIYLDTNDIYILNLVHNNELINLSKTIYDNGDELNLEIINGYKVIDVYNTSNIYNEYFTDLINTFHESNKRNPDGIIFRSRKFIEIEDIYWSIDKLYFSIYPNKTKYSLLENYKLLDTIKDNHDIHIVLYYKTSFVRYNNNTKNYLSKVFNVNFDNDYSNYYDTNNKQIKWKDLLCKYHYINGLYDRDNKILYTSHVFKQLNNIDYNYGANFNDDKNVIYVDPYNLSKLYKVYLFKNYNHTNQYNTNNYFYCHFLNMDHIKLYFEKLYKTYDLSGSVSINDIYIKVRNFNNIIIDLEDSKNTNYSTISVQDEYIPINDFGIGMGIGHNKTTNDNDNGRADIAFYISYDSVLKCFYFNEDYMNDFIEVYQEWVDHNKSFIGTRVEYSSTLSKWTNVINTLDKYHITNFEICFKKEMIELNKDLYNLIISRENDDIFKDLYLYHIYDPKDYIGQMNYNEYTYDYIIVILENCANINVFKDYLKKYQIESGIKNKPELSDDRIKMILWELNEEYENKNQTAYETLRLKKLKERGDKINVINKINIDNRIDKSLYPYFNDVYEEGRTKTKIYSDYFINNISKAYYDLNPNSDEKYRYNEPSINFLAYIPNNVNFGSILPNISADSLSDYRYSLVNPIEDRFLTASEFAECNIVDNTENLDQYSNLITYNYNGTYYGFYIINSYFDNTNNTLNIQNEDLDNIKCVDFINNIPVHKIYEESSYLAYIYKSILPYLRTTNPLKFVINNVDTLIKPQIYKLKDSIKQYPNSDNNIVYSYTLYNTKKSSTIELSRYFDNIVPFTPEVKYLNSYYLYYKDTKKHIEHDLAIDRKPYIMYQNQIDINRFSYVSYFDIDSNINKFVPTEYKYYNHNRFFNLEKEITINIDNYFTEAELIEFESDKNNLFNLFVNYINNDEFDNLPDKDRYNNYLFLYKKYEIKFIKDYKFINSSNQKTYSLTIKFSLL